MKCLVIIFIFIIIILKLTFGFQLEDLLPIKYDIIRVRSERQLGLMSNRFVLDFVSIQKKINVCTFILCTLVLFKKKKIQF